MKTEERYIDLKARIKTLIAMARDCEEQVVPVTVLQGTIDHVEGLESIPSAVEEVEK